MNKSFLIILGYSFLNAISFSYSVEENKSEQTYENILNIVANQADDNNEVVRQLAHDWIEHNPQVTYDQLVQYYQTNKDEGYIYN